MKTQKGPKRCWHLRGFDGTTEILDETLPIQQMSERGIKELLRAFAARHLSTPECIAAYAKRSSPISSKLLDIREENQFERRRVLYTCGDNPHYIATTEECE